MVAAVDQAQGPLASLASSPRLSVLYSPLLQPTSRSRGLSVWKQELLVEKWQALDALTSVCFSQWLLEKTA